MRRPAARSPMRPSPPSRCRADLFNLRTLGPLHHQRPQGQGAVRHDVTIVAMVKRQSPTSSPVGHAGRRWSDGQHQASRGRGPAGPTQTDPRLNHAPELFLLYPFGGHDRHGQNEARNSKRPTSSDDDCSHEPVRPRLRSGVQNRKTPGAAGCCERNAHIHKQGRPVLVGTTSVEKSELLSSLLAEQILQPAQRQTGKC